MLKSRFSSQSVADFGQVLASSNVDSLSDGFEDAIEGLEGDVASDSEDVDVAEVASDGDANPLATANEDLDHAEFRHPGVLDTKKCT